MHNSLSVNHMGEQLTLNQWGLGSSPRWCTKNTAQVSQKLAACAVFLFVWRGFVQVGFTGSLNLAEIGK